MDGQLGRIRRWDDAITLAGTSKVDDRTLTSALAVSRWHQALVFWKHHGLQVDVISSTAVLRALRSRWIFALNWFYEMRSNGILVNCITLNTALNSLQKRGRWYQVLDLFAQDLRRTDVVTFNCAIASCEELSRWPIAVELLLLCSEEQLRGDTLGFSACLGTAVAAAKWSVAHEVLRWMMKDVLLPNLVSFSKVLGTAQWQQASHVLEQCQDLQLLPDTILFGASISCCTSGHAWKQGLGLATRRASLIGCNAAMDGCGEGAWELLMDVFSELTVNGLVPSVASYNVAAVRWRRAIWSLMFMDRQKLKRDIISFGVALKACQTQSFWQTALYLMEDLEASQLVADQVAYNSCTVAAGEVDQWQRAMQLKEVSKDTATCNAAINACDGPGQWSMALQCLHTMLQSELRVDELTYHATTSACRPWRRALSLTYLCDLPGYSAVISACGALWRIALDLVELLRCRRIEVDTIAYNGAGSACAQGLEWQVASFTLAMLPRMLLQQQDYCFNAVLSACAKAEQQAAAGLDMRSVQKDNRIPFKGNT
eukprot:symbB.v1.2.007089.t1/scaffold431.1/size205911/2